MRFLLSSCNVVYGMSAFWFTSLLFFFLYQYMWHFYVLRCSKMYCSSYNVFTINLSSQPFGNLCIKYYLVIKIHVCLCRAFFILIDAGAGLGWDFFMPWRTHSSPYGRIYYELICLLIIWDWPRLIRQRNIVPDEMKLFRPPGSTSCLCLPEKKMEQTEAGYWV